MIATLSAVLVIGGCGGDDDSGADEPPTPTTTVQTPPDPSADPPVADAVPDVGDGMGGVTLEAIGNFAGPLYVTQPPAEQEDIYVVEQAGRLIKVSGGQSETYLDVSSEVTAGGEQGLLSVAFAPDFDTSGLLYVNYTDNRGDTRIVEYRDEGGSVDPASARAVLSIDQPFERHNGGLLKFGPDELLYVATGDGGSAADPQRNALDLSSLLGKILRIDPREAGGDPYSIPADNTFVGEAGGRGEIYSYGLRNPWRFSFDRRTGALAIGDVGQSAQEEVDLVGPDQGAGANFGWSAFEGTDGFNSDQEAPDAVPPVLTYPHSDGNCAVTGGYVVRDQSLPSLFGRYLYGDFCVGELRSFPADPGTPARDDVALGVQVPALSSFGEDSLGRIYVTSLEGQVSRLVAE